MLKSYGWLATYLLFSYTRVCIAHRVPCLRSRTGHFSVDGNVGTGFTGILVVPVECDFDSSGGGEGSVGPLFPKGLTTVLSAESVMHGYSTPRILALTDTGRVDHHC